MLDCPHCNGRGTVDDDFLTDELVAEVFEQYCDIFNIHLAYGIERWEDGGITVDIVQDTSCRGCYDTQRHYLPREWFTRDVELRTRLMQDKRASDLVKAEADRERTKQEQIESLRWQLERLEGS